MRGNNQLLLKLKVFAFGAVRFLVNWKFAILIPNEYTMLQNLNIERSASRTTFVLLSLGTNDSVEYTYQVSFASNASISA